MRPFGFLPLTFPGLQPSPRPLDRTEAFLPRHAPRAWALPPESSPGASPDVSAGAGGSEPDPPDRWLTLRLIEVMTDLAGLESVLRELVEFGTDVIPGCDGACVIVAEQRDVLLMIASDPWAATAERIRAWADFGPCLRVPAPVAPVAGDSTGDPFRATVRMPLSTPVVAGLCLPVPAPSGTQACLHLYSCDQTRWPSSSVRAARSIAEWAGEAILFAPPEPE